MSCTCGAGATRIRPANPHRAGAAASRRWGPVPAGEPVRVDLTSTPPRAPRSSETRTRTRSTSPSSTRPGQHVSVCEWRVRRVTAPAICAHRRPQPPSYRWTSWGRLPKAARWRTAYQGVCAACLVMGPPARGRRRRRRGGAGVSLLPAPSLPRLRRQAGGGVPVGREEGQ